MNIREVTEAKIRVSLTLIKQRSEKEPIIFKKEIKRFSGPWCASSEISKRSETILEIMSPVLFLS